MILLNSCIKRLESNMIAFKVNFLILIGILFLTRSRNSMSKFNKPYICEFNQCGDERGYLVVAESYKEVPFQINRVFYIFGTEANASRGNHANRISEFMLIVVSGSCKVDVEYDSYKETFNLNHQNQGLYLPPMVWKTMYDFSPDCVLLVLCSTPYIADEYIRDYSEYENEIKNKTDMSPCVGDV